MERQSTGLVLQIKVSLLLGRRTSENSYITSVKVFNGEPALHTGGSDENTILYPLWEISDSVSQTSDYLCFRSVAALTP